MSYWGLILKSADINLVGLKLYENVSILYKDLNTFKILIKSTIEMWNFTVLESKKVATTSSNEILRRATGKYLQGAVL